MKCACGGLLQKRYSIDLVYSLVVSLAMMTLK